MEVTVVVERGNKTLNKSKLVQLETGKTVQLAFDFEENTRSKVASQEKPASPTHTWLTLNVPAQSQVKLSGNSTSQTGPVRTFATTQLAEGAEWKNYGVDVSLTEDGKTVTRQQTITLTGGTSRSLTFDFGTPQVAKLKQSTSH